VASSGSGSGRKEWDENSSHGEASPHHVTKRRTWLSVQREPSLEGIGRARCSTRSAQVVETPFNCVLNAPQTSALSECLGKKVRRPQVVELDDVSCSDRGNF